MKALKNAAGVSFADILHTGFSRAIQIYLERMDCPVYKKKKLKCMARALLAVGFPRSAKVLADKSTALGNKW